MKVSIPADQSIKSHKKYFVTEIESEKINSAMKNGFVILRTWMILAWFSLSGSLPTGGWFSSNSLLKCEKMYLNK